MRTAAAALHNPGAKARAALQVSPDLFGAPQRMTDTRHLDQRITLAQDRATRFTEILLSQIVLSGTPEQLEGIAKSAALLAAMLAEQEKIAQS